MVRRRFCFASNLVKSMEAFMKLRARGSVFAASALAIALAPALFTLTPATAATVSSEGKVDRAVESSALEIYETLDSAADPQAAFEALSPNDKERFESYFLPATAEETVHLAPLDAAARTVQRTGSVASTYTSAQHAKEATIQATAGCWGNTSKITMYAAAGNAIWDTFTEGSWCVSGSTVTSATFGNSWSSIAAIGWRDDGKIGSGTGVTGNQARIWAQRKLVFGTGGWDVQTSLPCNRLSGTASGGASYTATCSIY
jgi:hypothetical protein